jgi:predicted Zn-dependent protease
MHTDLNRIATDFANTASSADYWTLRLLDETGESLVVRDDVAEPSAEWRSRGAMITCVSGDGLGYAATSDISPAGIARAATRAFELAQLHARLGLFSGRLYPRSRLRSAYASTVDKPWRLTSLKDKLALLTSACRQMDRDERIVERSAWLHHRHTDQLLITSDGGSVAHSWEQVSGGIAATAHRDGQTQTRRGGGAATPCQGGLERIDQTLLASDGQRVAEEAMALVEAPECPSGVYDLLLTPSQMALQIHESIGHPLELDRILGDERNYAGLSFVTPEMFGRYRYGSPLLNVTFDPTLPNELASCAADDDGTPAERVHLIRNGILERPLGGALSQARAGLAGTANARASGWQRAPIDRMTNINLEPGDEDLEAMIARVEHGVLMDTNRSWSIDDSRNKFQFGCEVGRVIKDGELKHMVRNPSYRGISARFWRSLDGVGTAQTREVGGVRNCGKGEPNQSVYVGHASPPCLFRQVELFGGGL